MYNSIDTNRVSSFPQHFKAPEMSDIPYPGFKDHPNGREILSNERLQCKAFPSIYIIENSTDFFYCSNCNCWYSLSNTFGNIKKHLKRKHLVKKSEIDEITDDEIEKMQSNLSNIDLPENIDKIISSRIKSMILKTGKPFSMVCDNDLRSCLKFLGTRQELSEKCDAISSIIKGQMKYILKVSSFITIAIDEWQDLNKRKYLGVSCKCFYNGNEKVLFLSQAKINSISSNSQTLKNMLFNILDQYAIRNCILSAVSDNCNVMEALFTQTHMFRLPCACHLINILLRKFLKPSEKIIKEISACIHSLKSSSTYAYLRDEFGDPHIASYSEIRWVSLHDAFKSLHKSHDSINTFYELDEDGNCTHKLEDKHWRFIESLLPMLKIYKSAIKLLESDEFSTISLVIYSLHRIKKAVEKLPSHLFKDNISKFKAAFEKKNGKIQRSIYAFV